MTPAALVVASAPRRISIVRHLVVSVETCQPVGVVDLTALLSRAVEDSACWKVCSPCRRGIPPPVY